MQVELIRGRYLRRYKRFFADVELEDGTVVTAHCANTGSMKTLDNPGVEAWLTPHDNPKRKLPWTLTLLGLPEQAGLALVDTALPNRLVADAISDGRVPELSGYAQLRREVRVGAAGRSRMDLLLEEHGTDPRPCFIEVKNNTMASRHAGRGDFPDSRTERGQKHLRELMELAETGARVVQFFVLGRTDCHEAGVAEEIDPDYARILVEAMALGVEVLVYRVDLSPREIRLSQRCPFIAPGSPSPSSAPASSKHPS